MQGIVADNHVHLQSYRIEVREKGVLEGVRLFVNRRMPATSIRGCRNNAKDHVG
jgi:hypothetical protein